MIKEEMILAEIKRLKKELVGYSAQEGLDYIESYINSVQESSLPSIKGWVARDACGRVCLFLNEPHLNPKWGDTYEGDFIGDSTVITHTPYEEPQMPWLTFENSPQKVELLIRRV